MHRLEFAWLILTLFPLIFSERPDQCEDGRHYCGSKLTELGIEGYENNTLYRCQGGRIMFWSNCSGEPCNEHRCKCHPGRYYCGHDLSQMGWLAVTDRPMDMYQCTPNGLRFAADCHTCVNGDPMPTCDCRSGSLYCGSTLQLLGYDGYANGTDTVYSCQRDLNGTKLTEWARCEPGFCEANACKCSPGKLYCGYELYEMGWRYLALTPLEDRNKLARCIGEFDVNWLAICGKCQSRPEGSRCDCHGNSTSYCGHELPKFGWKGYQNHTIYNCDGLQNVKVQEICRGECLQVERNASCIEQ